MKADTEALRNPYKQKKKNRAVQTELHCFVQLICACKSFGLTTGVRSLRRLSRV